MIVVYRYTFLFEKKILVSRHTFLNRFYLRLSSCVTRVAIVTIGFPKKKKESSTSWKLQLSYLQPS